MYRGRFFQGEIVPLVFQTTNSSGTPTAPSNPPYIDLRDSGGLIRQVQMPVIDKALVTGLFLYPLFLDDDFPAGNYSATYFANAGSHPNLEVDTFEVVAGGDEEGAIVTQHYWQRPEATYLIQQTQAESILLKRNPSLG